MYNKVKCLNIQKFIDLRRKLHQIPELGFKEYKTQQTILEYLEKLPKNKIKIKKWKTGILVLVKGTKPKNCFAYRTDIDGLPIEEETDLKFKSKHSSCMHACGHDMHTAIALGILTYFAEKDFEDDILFIFQPAEEGPGGALPLLKSKEFQEFKPDVIFALHIAPNYPVGTVATKPKTLFANTSELFITLHGKSGHASLPHKANDMVIAAATLILQLQTIVSRNINPLESAIVNIGKVTAGTKQNIIANKASIEGTIRSFSFNQIKNIKERILALTKGIEQGFNCKAKVNFGTNYYKVFNDEKLTLNFMSWLNNYTNYKVVKCKETMAGEDFGFFLKKIKGFMFLLGVDSKYDLHHPKLNPKEEAIEVGIDIMVNYIKYLSKKIDDLKSN